MEITEVSPEYMNKFAQQIILISSLLAGFSITVVANLLVRSARDRLAVAILKVATLSAGCFLVTVFAMTKLLMLTTPGYPTEFLEEAGSLLVPRIIGLLTFVTGLATLTAIIALAGWTHSRRTGIFTTAVGAATFLLLLFFM